MVRGAKESGGVHGTAGESGGRSENHGPHSRGERGPPDSQEAIQSASWADEVFVVVDSASTDGTAEAALSAPKASGPWSTSTPTGPPRKTGPSPGRPTRGYSSWTPTSVSLPSSRVRSGALMVRCPTRTPTGPGERTSTSGRIMRLGGWQIGQGHPPLPEGVPLSDRRVHAEMEGCAPGQAARPAPPRHLPGLAQLPPQARPLHHLGRRAGLQGRQGGRVRQGRSPAPWVGF